MKTKFRDSQRVHSGAAKSFIKSIGMQRVMYIYVEFVCIYYENMVVVPKVSRLFSVRLLNQT